MFKTVSPIPNFITDSMVPNSFLWILMFAGDEDYLILGCDGLWDTVTPATAIELLDAYLLGGEDKNESARMLVSQAKSRGSTDNISVVVVFLDEHKTELRSVLKNPDQDKLTEDLKDNLRI